MLPRVLLLAAAATATVAGAPTASAAVFQVGFGAGCYSPDLQEVLDAAKLSPGPDFIALTSSAQLTALALVIDAQEVTIVGGYDDCALAVQGGRSVLDGTGGVAAPVLSITGPADVVLEHVELRGGDSAATMRGGGARFVGSGRLRLRDSVIAGNVAGSGGGIAVIGDGVSVTELVLDADTRIAMNQAIGTGSEGRGGGVWVQAATLTANAATLVIADNLAHRRGGGLYLQNAVATLASGGDGADALLTRNHADVRGGAISSDGSAVELFTRDPLQPTRLVGNTASAGAGIVSTGGTLTGWDVVLEDNRSSLHSQEQGTALELSGSAHFVRDLAAAGGAPVGAVNCAPELVCNRFEANRGVSASGSRTGNALAFLRDGATGTSLLLEGATVRGNSGSTLTGAYCPLGVGACALSLTLRASVIAENVVNYYLFDGYAGIDLGLDLVSLTRNPGVAVLTRAGGSVDIRRSVIWEPGRPLWDTDNLLPGRSVTASYSLLHEGHGLDALPGTVIMTDPRFAAPASGDLQLGDDSPALDYLAFDATAPDAALAPRNVDLVEILNLYGPLDLGAYERARFDKVFRDGFEAVAP